jgi:hypothetical protein
MSDPETGMNARHKVIAERKARARQIRPNPRVRVLPRDDGIRKNIVHWPTGIAFPATGSVEWPNDRFTQRRIRDGDVTVEEAGHDSDTVERRPRAEFPEE